MLGAKNNCHVHELSQWMRRTVSTKIHLEIIRRHDHFHFFAEQPTRHERWTVNFPSNEWNFNEWHVLTIDCCCWSKCIVPAHSMHVSTWCGRQCDDKVQLFSIRRCVYFALLRMMWITFGGETLHVRTRFFIFIFDSQTTHHDASRSVRRGTIIHGSASIDTWWRRIRTEYGLSIDPIYCQNI